MILVHSKEITPHAYLCEVDGMILEHNQTWHNEDSSGFCRRFFSPQECVSFTLRESHWDYITVKFSSNADIEGGWSFRREGINLSSHFEEWAPSINSRQKTGTVGWGKNSGCIAAFSSLINSKGKCFCFWRAENLWRHCGNILNLSGTPHQPSDLSSKMPTVMRRGANLWLLCPAISFHLSKQKRLIFTEHLSFQF